MKIKRVCIKQLIMILVVTFLLSSFLAFSSIPDANANYTPEGDNEVDALAMGQAWVTTYNSAGGMMDIAYVSFGHHYGYSTELSAQIGTVVDTLNHSYVINWRPNVLGDTLQVCGIRVAYFLPDGAGGFEPTFTYKHIPGSVLLPRASTVDWQTDWTGGCIYLKSGPAYEVFNIYLNIPDGSKIEYLRVYYFRESLGYLPLIKR